MIIYSKEETIVSKHKILILSIIKSFLNILFCVLYFLPIIHCRAQYPTSDGNVINEDYFFSIYHNIVIQNVPFAFIFWLAISISVVSLVLSVISIIYSKSTKLKTITNIFVIVSFILFVLMFFLALACSPAF